MEKRLSRFGVGPRIAVPTVAYTAAAWIATCAWPGIFRLRSQPDFAGAAGVVLIALGLMLWFVGIVTVMRAYHRDRLLTSGAFALVRHPAYSGWITLALPGLALYFRSWLMWFTPIIAYAIFKRVIQREDRYLERRFGQAYLDYRRRVNELIPIPRFWHEQP